MQGGREPRQLAGRDRRIPARALCYLLTGYLYGGGSGLRGSIPSRMAAF